MARELLTDYEEVMRLKGILQFSGIEAKIHHPAHAPIETGDEIELVLLKLEPRRIHLMYSELLNELFNREHLHIEVYSLAMQETKGNTIVTMKYKEVDHNA